MSGWRCGRYDAITDVPGVRVGHWTDRRAATGCTVLLCERATAAAAIVGGGAPGTRETDVLGADQLVRTCQAVVLAGGSAYGLAAADGVMRYLEERDVGFTTLHRRVPIVPAAVLYDLGLGQPRAAPGPDQGYLAASRAKGGRVAQGCVGAGTGATVAKLLGPERMLKGGVGTASVVGPRGFVVGAIAATNAIGTIVDAAAGSTIAGPRGDAPGSFVPLPEAAFLRTERMDALTGNTTLVCVAVNAALAHHEVRRVAHQARDGLARAILPAHTSGDGDIVFVAAMGDVPVQPHDVLTLGLLATVAVERAILASVLTATTLHGVPSARDWLGGAQSAPSDAATTA